MEKENIFYAGTPKRYEMWEKEPVRVVNTLEKIGLPSLQKIEGNEVTGKKAVDIDSRALQNKDCPNIVFGRPHAGEFVPEELWDNSTEEGKKSLVMIDKGTELIFRSEKVPSVGTKISRLIVDPNRAPLMSIDSLNPKAIGKVFWFKGVFGENIYKEGMEPKKEEIEKLVEKLYLPYYNGMMGTIGALTDRRKKPSERVLVIDGHSFPNNKQFDFIWNNYEIENSKELPLFIIGDRDGASCDQDIRDNFAEKLEENFNNLSEEDKKFLMRNSQCKKIVGVNEYLKGVHNVQFFGQREEGVNAIQLELNESVYFDDEKDNYYEGSYNKKALEMMQKLIERTCLDIDPLLKK